MDKKRKLVITVIAAAVFTAVVLLAFFGIKWLTGDKTEQEYRDLADKVTIQTTVPSSAESTQASSQPKTEAVTQAETKAEPTINKAEVSNTDVGESGRSYNFQELTELNPDVYSWIYIPNTNVNYPVVQHNTEDNFYLDHDVFKNYSFPGSIYSQMCNLRDWSDRVTLLYGHNMLNGSMFATLHNFSDESFFDQNRYIYIYTKDNRSLTYEVVSAFTYDSRHIMNSFNFQEDSQFREWLDTVQNPHSLYANVNHDVKLDLNSKLIVLSTCLNGGGDGRFLVVGVLT